MNTKLTITTAAFTLSFPHLTELDEVSGKYSITMLIPKSDIAGIKALNDKVALAKAPAGNELGLRLPVKDGDVPNNKGVLRPEQAGHMIIKASSKFPVKLYDNQVKLVPVDQINQVFYAGCKCVAHVKAHYYAGTTGKGVMFILQAIQKVGEGTPMASANNFADAFAPVEISNPFEA